MSRYSKLTREELLDRIEWADGIIAKYQESSRKDLAYDEAKLAEHPGDVFWEGHVRQGKRLIRSYDWCLEALRESPEERWERLMSKAAL